MNNDKVIKKVLGNGKTPSNKMFKDSDGDGVMNVYDCKPYDKNKQGIIHDAKEAIKNKFNEKKEEYKEERAFKKEVREKERDAYREARKEAVVSGARDRARAEETENTRRYKERLKPRSSSGGNFAGLSNALIGGGSSTRNSMPSLFGSPVKTTTTKRRKIKVPVKNKRSRVTRKEVSGILSLRI